MAETFAQAFASRRRFRDRGLGATGWLHGIARHLLARYFRTGAVDGSIVMRVPAPRFAAALRDLRALGEVEVQTIRGEDVTAEYVDLRARLRIAKARRAVLLGLMDRATTIEQTIRVQNALDDTQLRIEELQGALSLLEDRVAYATIRLELHEEGVTPEPPVRNPSTPRAFDRAIAGFFGVVAGTIVGLGYLVPILVAAAVVWFVVRRVRHRRAA